MIDFSVRPTLKVFENLNFIVYGPEYLQIKISAENLKEFDRYEELNLANLTHLSNPYQCK